MRHWQISWEQLYDESGVPKTSIQGVIGKIDAERGDESPADKLGAEHQQRLADYFGFSMRWPEWCSGFDESVTVRRPDTAEKFRHRYERDAPEYLKPRVHEEVVSGGARLVAANGSSAERDTMERLKRGKRRQPVSPFGALAQIRIEPGQPSAGASQVIVEISCHEANIKGSARAFSLRLAELVIECGEAQGRQSAIPGFDDDAVVQKNSHGSVVFSWRGTMAALRWRASTTGLRIGSVVFDAGIVEELAHGDVLRASLWTWLKYIEVNESGISNRTG